MLRMLVDGGDARRRRRSTPPRRRGANAFADSAPPRCRPPLETTSVRPRRSKSKSRRRPTNALQGRAVYVCRRGACARAAFHPKTRRAHRALRVTGAFDPSVAAAAVIDVCVAAEVEDGVDSSRWVLDRAVGRGAGTGGVAPAVPGRADGREAEGSDQTFLVWAAERSDFGTGRRRRTSDWETNFSPHSEFSSMRLEMGKWAMRRTRHTRLVVRIPRANYLGEKHHGRLLFVRTGC